MYPSFKVPASLDHADSGVWLHHFQCPVCGKRHEHGGGPDGAPGCYGTRVPHCVMFVPQCPGWSLDKDYDVDIRPADESVDWHGEYADMNTHVVLSVMAADLPSADEARVLKLLSKNLDKALKTLP